MQQLKVKKRVPKTVSDKVYEQLIPKTLSSAVDDSDDEQTQPRISEFDENDAELEKVISTRLSDIRKKNIKYLDAIDKKYQGQVSSRKDIFDEQEDEDSSENSVDDDQQSEGESYQPGAFVRLKPSQESAESSDEQSEEVNESEQDEEDEDDESEDDDEDDEHDFSLGDFMTKGPTESQKLLQDENHQENVRKGICVQNQLKMWERLLEMRIKMQACLVTANSLPHEDKFQHLCKEGTFKEEADKVVQTVETTLKNLLDLQETLAGRFAETKDILKAASKRKLKYRKSSGNVKNLRLNEYESLIGENYASYKPYRNDVIQKWHDRTKASSNIKNAHQSLNIVKKIENSLLAKDELVRKTQMFRGGYELFEKPVTPTDSHPEDEPEPIYDEEIFDDSDFYHSLLRELIEFKSNTSENPQEIEAKFAELQKLRSKMKKQVDTRASKGRKIRYVVHKKLVNFTAPDDNNEWTDEAKTELFSSLFGGTSVSKDS